MGVQCEAISRLSPFIADLEKLNVPALYSGADGLNLAKT